MKATDIEKDLKTKQFINKNIMRNRYMLIVGISFLIYSIIEISDCIFLSLIILKLAPNLYISLGLIIPEIQEVLLNQPFFFLPFFLSFTFMRIVSTIGIFKNLMWGFYIGIISIILTMIMDIIFIPFGFFELFFCSIILVLLFIGYFGDKSII
ncbi:MAG: hypothetical protein ACFFBH_05410 [Promethearchaeota archaeon]